MRILIGLAVLLVGCTAGGPASTPDGSEGSPSGTPPDATVDQRPSAVSARSVPIYGGTMGHWEGLVVTADPARDAVGFAGDHHASVQLEAGSRPFRVALDGDRVFVTLRGTGEVVAFDHQGTEVGRQYVCRHPRGVDVHRSVHVACAGGELVTLHPQTLEIEDQIQLVPDLRDIVVTEDTAFVSRFRAADVLWVDREDGSVTRTSRPQLTQVTRFEMTPRVAWRMVGHPDGGVLMLHQAHSDEPIELEPVDDPRDPKDHAGAYDGNACGDNALGRPNHKGTGPLVSSHLTHVRTNGSMAVSGPLTGLVLPVDVAIEEGGLRYAVASRMAGEGLVSAIAQFERAEIEFEGCAFADTIEVADGIVTAVQATSEHGVVVFERGAGALIGGNLAMDLTDPTSFDGHEPELELFHENPGAPLVCASCHPEGQDDGHTWNFETLGPRRTQNLSGGLTARGQFHWDGEFDSLGALMDDVFTNRMAGTVVAESDVSALGEWLDGITPVYATPSDPSTVLAAGRALFEDPTIGCTDCHSGPALSDHQLHQIATGAAPTKTPSLLGVGTRAPYMHDGCASSMLDRFTDESCGGDRHGNLEGRSIEERRALAAYVMTL